MKSFRTVTHCIFDMDGLLINTEDLYSVAYKSVIAKYTKKEYTFEIKAKVMGRKPIESASVIVKELQIEDQVSAQEFIDQVALEYPKLFPQAICLPGVKKLISHLKAHNIPIAISTGSSNEAFALKSMNNQEFFSNFEFILRCGSDPEVKNGKPAPDAFEVARKRFSIVPPADKCLAFEDSPNGVKSGRAAGMQVVMVPDSRLSPEMTSDATLVLASMENFKPELFGLPAF